MIEALLLIRVDTIKVQNSLSYFFCKRSICLNNKEYTGSYFNEYFISMSVESITIDTFHSIQMLDIFR